MNHRIGTIRTTDDIDLKRIGSRRLSIVLDKTTVMLFIILWCSNDTYLFGTNANSFMVSLPRYIMLIFCLGWLFISPKLSLSATGKKQVIALMLMVSVFCIMGIWNHEQFNRVFIKILCILTGFLIAYRIEFEKFAKSYCKIIYLLSIFAILMSVIGLIMPGIIRALPSVTNSVGVRIYTCLIAGIDERMLGGIAVRTNSIFWEPGVYQMYLNLALLIEMYVFKINNKKRFAVEFIALFLTYSTTGYIVFAWSIASYYLFEKGTVRNLRRTFKYFVLLILAVVGMLIVLNLSQLGDVVFDKILNPTPNGTAMVRKASVIINLEIMVDNPVHGIGMENISNEFLRRSMESDQILGWTEQNTNTLLYQYAAHGVLYGLLFTIGTYNFGKILTNKSLSIICVFIFFVLMYIGENLQYSVYPYLVIFYGYRCFECRHKKMGGYSSRLRSQ